MHLTGTQATALRDMPDHQRRVGSGALKHEIGNVEFANDRDSEFTSSCVTAVDASYRWMRIPRSSRCQNLSFNWQRASCSGKVHFGGSEQTSC
jgi:hypothetical protein